MLTFDFDYYQPISIAEAVELFQSVARQGKEPIYFSGGTELLTLGRLNLVATDAVIDIKDIPELHTNDRKGGELILGAALSLRTIENLRTFPLLASIAGGIADHTSRGKITLGGNVSGRIFYREAVLPLLLCDSEVVLTGPNGMRRTPLDALFCEQLHLEKGELVVQFITKEPWTTASFFATKRRKQWDTGYPLITIAAVKMNAELRVAISGVCPFPFRSNQVEGALNDRSLPASARICRALNVVPGPVLDDVEGSADYRMFVLENLFVDVLQALEGE